MGSGMRTALKPVAGSESYPYSQTTLICQCGSQFPELTNRDGNVCLRSTGRRFHADVTQLSLQLPESLIEEAWGMQ